jgi:hypothetical protein
VGIGPDDARRNPFLAARLPTLRTLLGGSLPTLSNPRIAARPANRATPSSREAAAFPLDATLGMDGTPQSGTGQAALFTGTNAAERFGGHFGPWTPVKLRPLVEEENLLVRARDRGARPVFANAYPRGWPGRAGGRRLAAPPLAARAAGVLTRHEEDLAAGEAVASEIVNDGWIRHLGHAGLPRVTAEEAGRNLGRIAAGADLTVFAHYSTDYAGHRGGMPGAVEALERVDRFLRGVLEALPADATLLVASDHGNVEDVSGGHTRNPVLGVLAGPGAVERSRGLDGITDVAGAVVGWLGSPDP